MALPDDLADDFLLVDGLEPVTVKARNAAGLVTETIEVDHALQRDAIEQIQVGDRWVAPDEKTVWHMPVSELGGSVPAKGWTVEGADGIVWVVWIVQTQTFKARYRLTCIKE